MTHRIRMARKRLAIARERVWSATMSLEGADAMNEVDGVIMMLAGKQYRRKRTLRAIERRKDRTC